MMKVEPSSNFCKSHLSLLMPNNLRYMTNNLNARFGLSDPFF